VAKSKNLLSSWCSKAAIGAFVFGALLVACGDDNSGKNAGGTEEDSGIVAIADKTVSGVSQKGPFVNGSSVTVQELDGESLAQTGGSFEGKIKNDMGEFSVKVKNLESQYALLKANGFYRNEVTGEKSKSQVTLYALTDLSDRDEVNVNLLTHLAYERSLYLATEDTLSVGKAKKQAESEVLASFGIEGGFASAEDLSIFGTDDGAAALLAVSVLMQGDLSEADFSERLANYAADIEQDGKWDDFITATVIADWASNRSLTGLLAAIRENIAGWGLSADVPAFEKYVNRYWWQVYSLGFCDKDREGEVKTADNALSKNNGVHFICGDGAWRKATDVEYDTYEKKCDEDGKIVFGNVNKERPYDCDGNSWRKATEVEGVLGGCVESRFDEVAEALESHYICESRQWRKATDIEKDTYKWKAGKDGDSKVGSVNAENCYVFEDKAWRGGKANDCSLDLRGCTVLRQDTVALGSDKAWHICDAKNWRDATTYEKDTFGWKDSTDGAIKKGNVTDSIYVFDKTAWRVTSDVESKLGGCVAAIADSVGKVGSTYYICKSNKWVKASTLEYDTYRWTTGKDGDSKVGSVNAKNCYVFEDKVWRGGNASDCSLNLRGCTKLRQDTVGLGSDKVWHICDNKSWRDATDIEKDTATWGAASFEGEVRTGQVNKTIYYIYEINDESWRNATTHEKDTYDYENNRDWIAGADGEIREGSVTDSVYVYDVSVWRVADDIEKVLGGCVATIADSVGKVGSTYYICAPREWKIATELQYDTYKRNCGEDGKIFMGNVNTDKKYVCDDGVFRTLNMTEIVADSACTSYNRDSLYILPFVYYKYKDYTLPWPEQKDSIIVEKNYSYYKCEASGFWSKSYEKLNLGTMTDLRDGHVYKTIGIGTQLWMAENLNYADSINYPSMLERNWCYGNELDNCTKYGRLYTWSAAVDSVYQSTLGMDCGDLGRDGSYAQLCPLPKKVRGICPEGWHLPSSSYEYGNREELTVFLNYVGGEYGHNSLKETGFEKWDGATNKYGFSVLPSGMKDCCGEVVFRSLGEIAYFWSSSFVNDVANVLQFEVDDVHQGGLTRDYGLSVRCIKDEE